MAKWYIFTLTCKSYQLYSETYTHQRENEYIKDLLCWYFLRVVRRYTLVLTNTEQTKNLFFSIVFVSQFFFFNVLFAKQRDLRRRSKPPPPYYHNTTHNAWQKDMAEIRPSMVRNRKEINTR